MHQLTLLSPKGVEVKWLGLPIEVTLRNVVTKSDCTDILFGQFISFFLFIQPNTIYYQIKFMNILIGKKGLFTRGKKQ